MVSVYLTHVNDTQPQPQHMHINDGTTSNLENFPNRSSMHVKVKKDTCNNKGDKYNVVIRITSNWNIVSYFSFAETHCCYYYRKGVNTFGGLEYHVRTYYKNVVRIKAKGYKCQKLQYTLNM